MEPTTGFEPVNLFLTKEVLYLLSYVGLQDCSQTRGLEKVHNVKEVRDHPELDDAPGRELAGIPNSTYVVPTIMTRLWLPPSPTSHMWW
jgi:hypothetical protein